MQKIREIDRDHNGYVTSTELEDIMRLTFPKELQGKNIQKIIRKYASI
jgi:Ca2+-binding EF-hand superfamily protein